MTSPDQRFDNDPRTEEPTIEDGQPEADVLDQQAMAVAPVVPEPDRTTQTEASDVDLADQATAADVDVDVDTEDPERTRGDV